MKKSISSKYIFAEEYSTKRQHIVDGISAGVLSPYVRVAHGTLFMVDDPSGEEKYLLEMSDCELPVYKDKAITLIRNGQISTENLIETPAPFKEIGDIPYEFWTVTPKEINYSNLLVIENPMDDIIRVEYDEYSMTISIPGHQSFDLMGPRKDIIFKILNAERPVRSAELKPYLEKIDTSKDAAYIGNVFQGRYGELIYNSTKGFYSKGKIFEGLKTLFRTR